MTTLNWNARPSPEGARVIMTLDTHAAGEPLRIVTGGYPELPGATILERRRYAKEHYDDLRRALMWEPRGHADMYGCVLTPPVSAEANFGVLFLHNEGYSTMCGHGVIALVTALIETGAFPTSGAQTPVNLDTPAGLVRAVAHVDASGGVERVSFRNVPSFVYAPDLELDVAPYGRLKLDVVYGGAFYAYLDAAQVRLEVRPEQTRELVTAGEAIKRAVNAALTIRHPDAEDLGFLYGTILSGPPEDPTHTARNVCIFANAEVDRSPTGTGVSGHVALLAARGELHEGEEITVESILGAQSVFAGRIAERGQVGSYATVTPEISGKAFITGRHEFILDPRDTLGSGFLLG
ncbi:MAG TPA: proline racemase family protein [Ktedonobacterales bacterium]|jgi:proline racemase|nr:proline racemase family protein [Ktedonobacterales bacterium]